MYTVAIELYDRRVACTHNHRPLIKQSLQHSLQRNGRKGISDLQIFLS